MFDVTGSNASLDMGDDSNIISAQGICSSTAEGGRTAGMGPRVELPSGGESASMVGFFLDVFCDDLLTGLGLLMSLTSRSFLPVPSLTHYQGSSLHGRSENSPIRLVM